MHDISNAIAEFVQFGLDKGMTEPLYLVSIAANGSVLVSLFEAERSCDTVCEHVVAPGLAVPISLTLISPKEGRGMSASLVQGNDGLHMMPLH